MEHKFTLERLDFYPVSGIEEPTVFPHQIVVSEEMLAKLATIASETKDALNDVGSIVFGELADDADILFAGINPEVTRKAFPIADGWGAERYSFVMEIREEHPARPSVWMTIKITGYTSGSMDLDDPKLVLHISSFDQIRSHSPAGSQETTVTPFEQLLYKPNGAWAMTYDTLWNYLQVKNMFLDEEITMLSSNTEFLSIRDVDVRKFSQDQVNHAYISNMFSTENPDDLGEISYTLLTSTSALHLPLLRHLHNLGNDLDECLSSGISLGALRKIFDVNSVMSVNALREEVSSESLSDGSIEAAIAFAVAMSVTAQMAAENVEYKNFNVVIDDVTSDDYDDPYSKIAVKCVKSILTEQPVNTLELTVDAHLPHYVEVYVSVNGNELRKFQIPTYCANLLNPGLAPSVDEVDGLYSLNLLLSDSLEGRVSY